MPLLATLFFLVALLYSMVGFGGGSSYLALLALANVPYEWIPLISLTCNLIVVSGGVYHFGKKGLLPYSLIVPFIIGSIPMSYFGGRLVVPRDIFFILLGTTLLFAGIRLFLVSSKKSQQVKPVSTKLAVVVGAVLGMVSGVVGIGGGIFLTPLLLNFRWATPKQAAACASLFILLNSVFGLLGQVVKLTASGFVPDGEVLIYSILLVAVFLGGQLGSRVGSGKLSPRLMKFMTAGLVMFVGFRVIIATVL